MPAQTQTQSDNWPQRAKKRLAKFDVNEVSPRLLAYSQLIWAGRIFSGDIVKTCVSERGASELSDYLRSLLGLFFTVDEQDAGDDLRDQFEALEPAPMFLGFQADRPGWNNWRGRLSCRCGLGRGRRGMSFCCLWLLCGSRRLLSGRRGSRRC
jgi:hypothetical protein